MTPAPDTTRDFLRHTLATLAYRARKAVLGAPESFATFQVGEAGSRTPIEILAHMGDLFDWALALTRGQHAWREAAPGSWDEEVERFWTALSRFDEALAAGEGLGFAARLFQGPIADALTHVGQLSLLRRLAGAPVERENYFQAEIAVGWVSQSSQVERRIAPADVIRGYAAGERSFRGCDIEDPSQVESPSFRNASLAEVDFSHSTIVADFRGAVLRAASFRQANVKTCRFDGADLRNADFSYAALDATSFSGADLTGAKFEGAHIQSQAMGEGEFPDW